MILPSCLAPDILLPKPLPCPFLLHWCTCRLQPPARPQHFLGGGGFLTSMGPFQPKLFCDYVLLSARRALSKTGGLVTHEGRLPTPSLARCPLHVQGCLRRGSSQHPAPGEHLPLCLPSRCRADRSLTIPLRLPLHNPSHPGIPPTAGGCASCIRTCSYTACLSEYMYAHIDSIRIDTRARERDMHTSLPTPYTTFCNDYISYLPQSPSAWGLSFIIYG